MNKTLMKKILNISSTVLTAFIVIIALLFLVFTLCAKKDSDGTSQIFNRQFRLITTNSMGECADTDVSKYEIKSIPVKSLVFIETVPSDKASANKWYENLKKGDVLTFKYVYDKPIVITHRLIDKVDNGDGTYKLYLQGDNKNSEVNLLTQVIDTSDVNSENYVIGKVVGKSVFLGYLVGFMSKPKTAIFVVIIIGSILIIIEAVKKIISVQKMVEEPVSNEQKLDDEIEILKSKINNLLSDDNITSVDNKDEIDN